MTTLLTAPATATATATQRERVRVATRRRYLMCPPEHFAVTYAINPWMDPTRAADRDRAREQWSAVRDAHLALDHQVDLLPALPGLPDMVFAANGALVVDGRALGSRFRHPERRAEQEPHRAWLQAAGVAVTPARAHVEGEGDLLVAGTAPTAPVLAAEGPRTERAAHAEVARVLGRPVVGLRLVDPRFYHLDTALAVLDDTTVAVVPGALDGASLRRVRALFPEVVEVSDPDASVLGANAVSDGRHVVLEAAATRLADDLAARGFVPLPVDTSELRRAGGSVKCVTAEHHGRPVS